MFEHVFDLVEIDFDVFKLFKLDSLYKYGNSDNNIDHLRSKFGISFRRFAKIRSLVCFLLIWLVLLILEEQVYLYRNRKPEQHFEILLLFELSLEWELHCFLNVGYNSINTRPNSVLLELRLVGIIVVISKLA